jgi:hypothetical protein
VVNSTLDNCHGNNGDSQALLVINSPGPIRVENNTLHGGHQSVLIGGGSPAAQGVIPRDIIVRGNDMCRPLAWRKKWVFKVLFENKIAERELVEGNRFCNAYPDGQDGSVFNIKTEDQNGLAPWSRTADVTIRNNVMSCAAGLFHLSARQGSTNAIPASRITIYDNLAADSISTAPCAGTSDALYLGGVDDVVFVRNYIRNPQSRAAVYFSGVSQRFVATDNVFGGEFGFKGDAVSWTQLVPGVIDQRNVLEPFGTPVSGWPTAPVNAIRDALLQGVTIAP